MKAKMQGGPTGVSLGLRFALDLAAGPRFGGSSSWSVGARPGHRRLLFLLHLPLKTALASLCQRSLETTQSPTTKDPTLLLGPQGPGDRQHPVHILRKALAWVRCPDP